MDSISQKSSLQTKLNIEKNPQDVQCLNIKPKKKYKYTKKTGRPAFFKTPGELNKKIKKYFNGGAYKRKVITQFGNEIKIPTPTISDLVLYLGFCDRKAFYDYELKPQFSSIIKKARTMIEREYETLLRGSSCTGAIFALKNFGWIDTPLIDQSVKNYVQIYRPEAYTNQEIDSLTKDTRTNV